MSDLTGELLAAVVASSTERKQAALKLLRGEAELQRSPDQETGSGLRAKATGPLLLGMLAGAKFLGVSRATLWRMMKAGTLGKVELFPGSFRLRREDLEALAASKVEKSEPVPRR